MQKGLPQTAVCNLNITLPAVKKVRRRELTILCRHLHNHDHGQGSFGPNNTDEMKDGGRLWPNCRHCVFYLFKASLLHIHRLSLQWILAIGCFISFLPTFWFGWHAYWLRASVQKAFMTLRLAFCGLICCLRVGAFFLFLCLFSLFGFFFFVFFFSFFLAHFHLWFIFC